MNGNRVKKKREELNLSQQELADIADVSLHTVFRAEKGTNVQTKNIQSIAAALNTSVAYLLGETDDPDYIPLTKGEMMERIEKDFPRFQKHIDKINMTRLLGGSDSKLISPEEAGWRLLPLFSKLTAACGGAGNGLAYADSEVESWHYFPAEIYGIWDPERPPYMHYVDGDSMEEANIHDGSVIIVNPAEAIYDGESALVCWNNDEVAVKLIYWQKNGGVELHAASPENKKIYAFTKEDINDGTIEIKGKIMWAGVRPKRMK